MKEVPFTNEKDHAVHVGNKMIPSNETRMVDESMLPNAHECGKKQIEEPAGDPLLDILDGNVGEVTTALPGLSDDELDRIEKAETDGNTRKGVMKAIAEERLARASGDQVLLGSSVQPSMFTDADGNDVQLGDVVSEAHDATGLSVDDWNSLPAEDREVKLAAVVESRALVAKVDNPDASEK